MHGHLNVDVGGPPAVFVLLAHRGQDLTALKGIAGRPMSDAGPAQMTVEHPEFACMVGQRPTDLGREVNAVLGDERRPVGPVLIVDRDGHDRSRLEGVDRCAGRPAQIEADVVISLPLEEVGGVHGRTMLIVATDRIAMGSRPAFGARAGEIVNPIRFVKHHGGVERHRFA